MEDVKYVSITKGKTNVEIAEVEFASVVRRNILVLIVVVVEYVSMENMKKHV